MTGMTEPNRCVQIQSGWSGPHPAVMGSSLTLDTLFTWVYCSDKQSAAADILRITKKGLMTIATGDFFYNQRSSCSATLILLFRSILGILSFIHWHLFNSVHATGEFSILRTHSSIAF